MTEVIRNQTRLETLQLFGHPLAASTLVDGCVFHVVDIGVLIHGYSMYGRFLFTEPARNEIRNCRFIIQ